MSRWHSCGVLSHSFIKQLISIYMHEYTFAGCVHNPFLFYDCFSLCTPVLSCCFALNCTVFNSAIFHAEIRWGDFFQWNSHGLSILGLCCVDTARTFWGDYLGSQNCIFELISSSFDWWDTELYVCPQTSFVFSVYRFVVLLPWVLLASTFCSTTTTAATNGASTSHTNICNVTSTCSGPAPPQRCCVNTLEPMVHPGWKI